jgi:hypothetical protein
VRRFKLSNDPQFVAKLRDIVGLDALRPAQASQGPGMACSVVRAAHQTASQAGRLPFLQELKEAIHSFMDETGNPQPFMGTKDPDNIIAAVKGGHQLLDSIRGKRYVGSFVYQLLRTQNVQRNPAACCCTVFP